MKKILLVAALSATMLAPLAHADKRYSNSDSDVRYYNLDRQEDIIERTLERRFRTVSDGKTSLDFYDFDVEISYGQVYVTAEMEVISGDGGWSRFDPAKFDMVAKEMADIVKQNLQDPKTVVVIVKIDKDLGRDEYVFEKSY